MIWAFVELEVRSRAEMTQRREAYPSAAARSHSAR
jgi:hypothetical protein